jgi:hypothetical protein
MPFDDFDLSGDDHKASDSEVRIKSPAKVEVARAIVKSVIDES